MYCFLEWSFLKPVICVSQKLNSFWQHSLVWHVSPMPQLTGQMDHTHPRSGTDDALVHNVSEGCSDCFAQLFERYCRPVFSVSYRILRDRAEAEDLLQEVFLAIYLQRERFDASKGSVKTWILQFAYFKSLLRRRYLRIRHFYTQEELLETQEFRKRSPHELRGLTLSEWTRFVESGIAELTPKQRQVMELVHFEGYTMQETSEIVRETLTNTRNYYYRGLKALRNFLQVSPEAKPATERIRVPKDGALRFEP
jgi:RNA polymerase sigma-70 factor (ECF subfamily)